jgi:hypothetical protein
MIKERGDVASADERRDSPPPQVKCGRGHRHPSGVKVTECDDRLAKRAQHRIDEAARREVEAARHGR